jgi:hypothetical protein
MTALLYENLKTFKNQYLLSIFAVIIGSIVMIKFGLNSFPYQFSITFMICVPEFIRIDKIFNHGYLKLMEKLPLSENEIYFHKFFISSSGIIWVQLLFISVNAFYQMPATFFENLNMLIVNIFAGIVLHNSTKLFNTHYWKMNNNFFSIILFGIFYMVLFGIFGYITKSYFFNNNFNNQTFNYLLVLILQCIVTFYTGKLMKLIRTCKLIKSFQD